MMYFAKFCGRAVDRKIRSRFNYKVWKNEELPKHFQEFTQFEWMKKQSFCWKNHHKVKLQQIMTDLGICFVLNSPNVLDFEQ